MDTFFQCDKMSCNEYNELLAIKSCLDTLLYATNKYSPVDIFQIKTVL
jgi:hypothetical protein